MYSLYIGNKMYSSWSLRPWLLLSELGIPFEERLVRFESQDNREIFRTFSPNGKVPCLLDNERTIWDSLAIIEYIAESDSRAWPEDAVARAWARSACAEMHAGFDTLRNMCPMCCGVTVKMHSITPALQLDINRIVELWQQGLDDFAGPFLAGEHFTAVDAFFAPVVLRIHSYQVPVTQSIQSYIQQIYHLESLQKWYKSGLKEPWLEPQHEKEIRDVGNIIEDKRILSTT